MYACVIALNAIRPLCKKIACLQLAHILYMVPLGLLAILIAMPIMVNQF